MLGEGWKGGMRESGLVPEDQEEGNGESSKTSRKTRECAHSSQAQHTLPLLFCHPKANFKSYILFK